MEMSEGGSGFSFIAIDTINASLEVFPRENINPGVTLAHTEEDE